MQIGVLARDFFGRHAEDSRKKKIFSNPSTQERGPETPTNDGLNFNMRRMHRAPRVHLTMSYILPLVPKPASCCMSVASLSRLASATRVLWQANKPVAIFLNASRLDYDNCLDFSRIESLCDFRRNDTDYVTSEDDIIHLTQDAEIVICKEMQIPSTALKKFPPSVKLVCEAGTGYNNIPITQARKQGIAVCNVPTYSTDAVAHMAITYLMNLSISMFEQQRMLNDGDRRNFTGPFTLPLSELNGKTIGLIGGGGLIGSKVCDIALVLGMNVIISSRAGKLPETSSACSKSKSPSGQGN